MKSFLREVSGFYPAPIVSNEEISKDHPTWNLHEHSRATGVEFRRRLENGEPASEMAFQAARALFDAGRVTPEEIDFILYGSIQPDHLIPPTAIQLQDRLGLPRRAGGLDFSTACTSFLYGLMTASSLVETGRARNVLLLTSDAMTRFVHPGDRSTASIFGDGASATVISACPDEHTAHIGQFVFGSDGAGGPLIIIKNGGSASPFDPNAPDSTDEYGNITSPNFMFMDGSAVFNFSLRTLPGLIDQTLLANNLPIHQIDWFIFHQASRIMIESVAKKMKIPMEKVLFNLKNYGNTAGSSIPLAIWQARQDGVLRPGMTIALIAFGSGLSWISTIVHY